MLDVPHSPRIATCSSGIPCAQQSWEGGGQTLAALSHGIRQTRGDSGTVGGSRWEGRRLAVSHAWQSVIEQGPNQPGPSDNAISSLKTIGDSFGILRITSFRILVSLAIFKPQKCAVGL